MSVNGQNLEQFVRPNEARPWLTPFPQTTPPAVLPPVDAPSESASASEQFQGLEWGDPLNSNFASTGISGFKTIASQNLSESTRSGKIVRVKNEDDPSQHVDVERVEKITFDVSATTPGGGGAPGPFITPGLFGNAKVIERTLLPGDTLGGDPLGDF